MARRAIKAGAALDSATEVFTRYGFERATMSDIAAKAGMSRPALYLVFPDKEAAFAQVIARMDERKLVEITTVLPTLDSLEARLLHACQSWGVHGMELAAVHPDAADLFDIRFPAVQTVFANFQALIVQQLAEAGAGPPPGVAPSEFARAVVFGMRGLRDAALDADDMRRLIAVHVRCFVQALSFSG